MKCRKRRPSNVVTHEAKEKLAYRNNLKRSLQALVPSTEIEVMGFKS
jgi:hypothetical protein